MAATAIRRDDPRPLYKQVKDRLLEALADGRLPPMSKLASERELVERYGVSRITIRQAMRELVSEGHLRSHPGKGFYATGRRVGPAFELDLLRSFTLTAEQHGYRPGSRLLEGRVEPAADPVARMLAVANGTPLVSLRRLRLLDEQPVAIAEDWIEERKVPDLLSLDWDRGNRSLYGELIDRYGMRPARGETVLAARLARPEEADLLELSAGEAVLTVEQIAYDAEGQPINFTISVHHPSRYPLRLAQGARTG